MPTTALPAGEPVPTLGQGTWNIGDDPSTRQDEIAALQRGIELGLTLVDTAEMYGDGGSELLVGHAIAGRRDDIFLVSKVYPHNAARAAMQRSCEASLRRLRVDTLDLYLLHWPGSVSLAETIEGFEALRYAGKIRHWGVSNFDLREMQSLASTAGGEACQVNQVLYHLAERGIEWDLQPWMRERGMPVMAYSPFDQGRLLEHRGLARLAQEHGRSPTEMALGWLLSREGVIAVPKSARRAKVEENAKVLERPLSAEELRALEAMFPAPAGPRPLAML